MRNLRNKLLILFTAFGLLLSFSASPVHAQCPGTTTAEQIKCGANAGAGQNETNTTKKLNDTISSGLNIFTVILGVIAVIMVMVGGLRYITSAGDPSRIAAAKNTLVYAIIGLIVVALAQVIVRFVLNTTTTANNPRGSNSSPSLSLGSAKPE